MPRELPQAPSLDAIAAVDVFSNLRSAITTVGGTQTSNIQYTIDGLNRRVAKTKNGAHQYSLLYKDQLEPVAMLDAAGAVSATFVYASREHVPDFMVKGGVTYRYIVDHLGSVRMVVNTATGAVAQRIDYDEFGKPTLAPGSTWATQPFGFAGGIYDEDTGLVRFGARDYDASTGRWTAKDPILWDGGQTNLYQYVGGDPVNRVDPSGRNWFDDLCEKIFKKGRKKGDGAGPTWKRINKKHGDAANAGRSKCIIDPSSCTDEEWVDAMQKHDDAVGEFAGGVNDEKEELFEEAEPE